MAMMTRAIKILLCQFCTGFYFFIIFFCIYLPGLRNLLLYLEVYPQYHLGSRWEPWESCVEWVRNPNCVCVSLPKKPDTQSDSQYQKIKISAQNLPSTHQTWCQVPPSYTPAHGWWSAMAALGNKPSVAPFGRDGDPSRQWEGLGRILWGSALALAHTHICCKWIGH